MNNNNFFWGVDFYPTPMDVIDRMLMDVDCADKVVLEPSAGAGAIVDELKKRGARVIACEIDPRFRNAVRRAGILARRLPSVEQLKRNNETARDNNNGHDQQ